MKILLDKGAHVPIRAHKTDAGMDLYAMDTKTLKMLDSACFDTGVHIQLPPNTYGKIESKSGLNVKHGIVSCGGVIDEGYIGSIVVKLYNFGHEDYEVHIGDKIAQLVIMPCLYESVEVVDKLEDTNRGNNGFGSTGR